MTYKQLALLLPPLAIAATTLSCGEDDASGAGGAGTAGAAGAAGAAGSTGTGGVGTAALPCANGVCRDESRNLDWQQVPTTTELNWEEALEYCPSLGSGWRLPTIDELRTLIRDCDATEPNGSCGVSHQCIEYFECRESSCDGCPPTGGDAEPCLMAGGLDGPCDRYWSSSHKADYETIIWLVFFQHGRVDIRYKGPTSLAQTRCVRGEGSGSGGSSGQGGSSGGIYRCDCTCECAGCIAEAKGELAGPNDTCQELCPSICYEGPAECEYFDGTASGTCYPDPG